jgi:hypothetical protein
VCIEQRVAILGRGCGRSGDSKYLRRTHDVLTDCEQEGEEGEEVEEEEEEEDEGMNENEEADQKGAENIYTVYIK